jgi:hypothetical protein
MTVSPDNPTGAQQYLERQVLGLTHVLGAVLGIATTLLLFPSLLKQSPLICLAALLIGCLLGGWIGHSVGILSRNHLFLQRIMVCSGKGILAAIGILALAFACLDLYEFIRLQHPRLLANSSSLGTAGLIILGLSLQLSAFYVSVGFGVFAALAFFSWLYSRDTGLLMFNLGWNAAVAYGLILLFKIQRYNRSHR